jgi:hypothetical protein
MATSKARAAAAVEAEDTPEAAEVQEAALPEVAVVSNQVVVTDPTVKVRAKNTFTQIYGANEYRFVADQVYEISPDMYGYMKNFPGCFYERFDG